jgi:hypothetical protein
MWSGVEWSGVECYYIRSIFLFIQLFSLSLISMNNDGELEMKQYFLMYSILFFFFRIGFRLIKSGRLIQLVHRDMHTNQVLFS